MMRICRKAGYMEVRGKRLLTPFPRWVATTGEKGPWSETASATIGA